MTTATWQTSRQLLALLAVIAADPAGRESDPAQQRVGWLLEIAHQLATSLADELQGGAR